MQYAQPNPKKRAARTMMRFQKQRRGVPTPVPASVSPAPPVKHTVEEWEALPEEMKCELIDGEFVMFAAPSSFHAELVITIGSLLRNLVKGDACTVHAAPGVCLDPTKPNVFEPDIVVICDRGKDKRTHIVGAPDLVVEILSLSTAKRDKTVKLKAYKDAGVREYWLVDPHNEYVEVYFWEESQTSITYDRDDIMPVKITDGKTIDLSEVFPPIEPDVETLPRAELDDEEPKETDGEADEIVDAEVDEEEHIEDERIEEEHIEDEG